MKKHISKKLSSRIFIIILSLILIVGILGIYIYDTRNIYMFLRQYSNRRTIVSTYNSDKAYDGYTIFLNPHGTFEAMDMNGGVVHSFNIPNGNGTYYNSSSLSTFYYMKDTCSLLFTTRETGITNGFMGEVDKNSHLLWKVPLNSHHAFDTYNGKIYTFVYKSADLYIDNKIIPIVYDDIVVLAGNGTIIKEVSLLDILRKNISVDRMINISETDFPNSFGSYIPGLAGRLDLTHSNKIEVIRENISDAIKENYILFSSRNLNLIGIIDIDKEELVWYYDSLDGQHSPTITKNNTILVFDDGFNRGYSRIVEIDPNTKNIIWQYTSWPKKSFFSNVMGSVQQLPNDDMLITESTSNYLFEITRAGEKVWAYELPFPQAVLGAVFQSKRFPKKDFDTCN